MAGLLLPPPPPPLIYVEFENLGVINNTCWRGKSGKREGSPRPRLGSPERWLEGLGLELMLGERCSIPGLLHSGSPGADTAAAEHSPARDCGSHSEAEGLPTSSFSHSFPVTSSPAPTSAVHRRCSLGSRPRGLCLGGNSIQMELFFHIFGGEGRKVWEKAAGTGEVRGRSGFAGGLVSAAPFLRDAPENRGAQRGN